MTTISLRHYLAVIGGALCISFAPILAVLSTRGEDGVGMWDAAFWRLFFGAISLGLLFVTRRERILPSPKDFQKGHGHAWLWLPGLAFGGDFWAWHWSFENTSVANATLLANTAILWVTLFAWVVWKEHITRLFVSGALVAFAGIILLLLSSTRREPPAEGSPVFGDFLALLTAFFYAAYQLSMKRFRRDHSAPVLLFWASVVGALVLLPLALVNEAPFFPGKAVMWLPLIALGLVSHACGQGLIAYGLGGVPASLTSVTLLIQPVATAFLGVWMLGQALVPLQAAGAFVVVLGLFFAVRGQFGKRPAEPAAGDLPNSV